MNKTELITLLRDPSAISSSNLEEIVQLVDESPYFLSARLLLAKGSKELKRPDTKKRIASAAVYSTDRVLLKKYISGDLFFLSQPVLPVEKPVRKKVVTKSQIEEESEIGVDPKRDRRTDVRPSALKVRQKKPGPKVPNVPSGDLDAILEELRQDMENLKSSRAHFAEVQHKIDEEESRPESEEKQEKSENTEVLEIEDLKKDIEKEVIESEKSQVIRSEKPIKPTNKEKAEKEESAIEEEIINKKLAELAKQQEEIAAKVEKELKLEKTNKAKEKPALKTKEDKVKAIKETRVEDADKEQPIVKKESSVEKEDEHDNEQEEKAIRREPRFSRFSSRSYLRNLEVSEDDIGDFVKEDKPDENSKIEERAVKNEDDPGGTSEEAPIEGATVAKQSAPPQQEKPIKPSKSKKEKPTKTESNESILPKNTIIKKAKLVKRKRSTRQSGGAGKSAEPKLPKSKDDDDGKGHRKKQQKIIEKFIKESPSIKHIQKSGQNTTDLAENSTSWDENLASEHLAEIYLRQGNKKRAIEIYEVLSLKYPEKKSYFADLISKSK